MRDVRVHRLATYYLKQNCRVGVPHSVECLDPGQTVITRVHRCNVYLDPKCRIFFKGYCSLVNINHEL